MNQILNYSVLSICIFALTFCIYKGFFEKHLKAQSVLSDIETLKIDSTEILNCTNTIYYEIWIGGKYKVSIDQTKFKPFQSTDRKVVFVKDIDGNIVMSYDTKYNHLYSVNAWESDYTRLMNYIQSK